MTSLMTPGKIGFNQLKIGTGSFTSDINFETDLELHAHCFFPNLNRDSGGQWALGASADTPTQQDAVARFCFTEVDANLGTMGTDFHWAYITSSDKPFFYLLKDKTNGKIVAIWAADDPPNSLWGLDKNHPDFRPPVVFRDKEKNKLNSNYDELVIFNYPLDHFKEIRKQAKIDKKNLKTLLDDFEYDETDKLFKVK